ncbi:hypothetical protein CLIM01_12136 [Colletotrichum limetticola]|uniref:DNA 3'-5' helicase n=1 Tax=Colletotrichum limetticola TaxID=1209924 RepID=A0ABQ9PH77_9PEZI|nr:hypothetical protein CLIM01_12136 [Colletotrichum limetticola]
MLQLGALTATICPRRIFITATLPPSHQAQFLEDYHIKPDPVVIRTPTNRANTSYRHITSDDEDNGLLKEVQALVARHRQSNAQRSRSGQPANLAILYCRTVKLCDRVATHVDCPSYHAHLSDTSRAKACTQWLENDSVIAATSAFGAGIDQPNVVLVAHLGIPFNIITFMQMAGRAGRSGQPCQAIIVSKPNVMIKDPGLLHFVNATCKRQALVEYFDGDPDAPTCRDQFDQALCDRCIAASAPAAHVQQSRSLLPSSVSTPVFRSYDSPPTNTAQLQQQQQQQLIGHPPVVPTLPALPATGFQPYQTNSYANQPQSPPSPAYANQMQSLGLTTPTRPPRPTLSAAPAAQAPRLTPSSARHNPLGPRTPDRTQLTAAHLNAQEAEREAADRKKLEWAAAAHNNSQGLMAFLQILKRGSSCPFCKIFHPDALGDRHYLKDCLKAKLTVEGAHVEAMTDQLTSVRFQAYSGCYSCMLPQHQDFCTKFSRKADSCTVGQFFKDLAAVVLCCFPDQTDDALRALEAPSATVAPRSTDPSVRPTMGPELIAWISKKRKIVHNLDASNFFILIGRVYHDAIRPLL